MNPINCFFILLMMTVFVSQGYAQSARNTQKKSVLELAHKRKIDLKDYTKSDRNLFNVNVYHIDAPKINKTHHWFIKLANLEGNYVNYARLKLDGYLKHDPSVKFNFIGVTSLCSEGKYIIGFIKLKQKGTWILDIQIDNFDKKDTITVEVEVNE